MNLSNLIKQLWDRFTALFENGKDKTPKVLSFQRVLEAGSWRNGAGLWSGLIKPFDSRIYYLEVSRTSIADKRELKIKPAPTHTFKLFYYSKLNKDKGRVTVFLVYKNCYLAGSSEDYIAVELIGKAIHRYLQTLCDRSFVGGGDLTEVETIKKAGEVPQLRIKNNHPGIPATNLLNRSNPETQKYWQMFIDSEFQQVKNEQGDKSKRKGFRI